MLQDGSLRGWVMALVAAPGLLSCGSQDPVAAGPDGFTEPEVFEIIRAGNARAVLDSLTARYEDEMQHVRILREDIAELLAAEEGLARRLTAERQKFQDLQGRVGETSTRNTQEEARLKELEASLTAHGETRTQSEAALETLRQEIEALRQQAASLEAERLQVEADLAQARKVVAESPRPDPELIAQLRAILAQLDGQGAPQD